MLSVRACKVARQALLINLRLTDTKGAWPFVTTVLLKVRVQLLLFWLSGLIAGPTASNYTNKD